MPSTAAARRTSFLPFCCNQAAAQSTANAGSPLFQAFSPIPVWGSTGSDCIKVGVKIDRKVERGGFLYDRGVLAELGITPVNIAVSASGTAFGAAVPWVPERHGRLLSLFRSRFSAETILSRSGDSIQRAGSPHRHSDIASRFHIDKAFSDRLLDPQRLCSGKARRTSGLPADCLVFLPSCITSPFYTRGCLMAQRKGGVNHAGSLAITICDPGF